MAKKNKEVVIVSDKKKSVWIGSQSLMGAVVAGSKEAKERELIKMTARVLDISPFGVNILGNLPYINKLGLGQKSVEYGKGKDEFKYNWVQRAADETQKAICECKIVRSGKDITDWVTGECSPKTMKMGTLAGYQNHMAQTRAKNRAILEAYGITIHEDMMANIHKLYSQKQITDTQKGALEYHAGKATSSSIEEVEPEKGAKTAPIDNSLFHYETVQGPDNEPTLVCSKCDGIMSQPEADFSMKIYKKQLCRSCQKEVKRK